MRTLWRICSRMAIVLLAAAFVIGSTWLVGNRFGSDLNGPPRGEFQQTSVATTSDGGTSSQSGTFEADARRPEGHHHGNAGVGFALLGMAQNAAIILVIVLIVVGMEKALLWKKKTLSSMV